MQRNPLGLLLGTFFTFIIIVIGNIVIVAQNEVTGTWRSDSWSDKRSDKNRGADDDVPLDDSILKRDENKLHLSFSRGNYGRNQNQFGAGFAYSDLQGLTREQTQNGKVNFRVVREAGTIDCEGTFTGGKGSGTFRFVPGASYLDAMRSRGFDFEKAALKSEDGVEGKLLSAALINVTTALADDLNSANFGSLDVEDLFKAAIFKIDSKFMAEMKATGFPGLEMEDLVKARIFKIDADYVRQVHSMGFVDKDFEALVKFRIFKVTPEFLNELKTEGFSNLSSEDVVQFRIFKIDPAFIRQAKNTDPNITVEEMVQMKIGVYRKNAK